MEPAAHPTPERAELAYLLRLRAGGESIRLAAQRVRAVGAGGHLAQIRGRGVEFDESRIYQPGDDLRTIDWRVTARTGRAHTKVFREERNRPVVMWLDLRRPMLFATRGAFKAVRAAEAAALIAWSAAAHGDRLGGLVFNETDHHELRPALGRRAVLRWLGLVTSPGIWQPQAAQERADASVARALQRLLRVARPGSSIFLLSDFRDLAELDGPLRQLAGHGEVCLMHFYDPLEAELPPPGRYRVAAGDRLVTIDTADRGAREAYRRHFEARRARLRELGRMPQVRVLECTTENDPRLLLMRHFGST